MRNLVISLLVAGCVPSALGCDLCSIYAATQAQAQSGTGFFAGVAEQFTDFNTFQINGREASNLGDQHLDSSISQVFAGYNLNNHLGLQLNLPIIYREYGYAGKQGDDLGPGDISLTANVRLYQKLGDRFTFRWTALGGLKLPTGDAAHLNPAEPDFAPGIGGHDLALGSGSFDGIVGTGVFARWERLFLAGSMQYTVRSQGDFGYQFANDWIWEGGPGFYLLLGDMHTLSLQAVVGGETKSLDSIHGVTLDDTGITAVYLGPQINFTWSDTLSAQIGVDLPVSIESTGSQVVPDYRIRAAVTWRF